MNDAGQYLDGSSYIENGQMENEELVESPSYADKLKKAVAATATVAYAVTQLGCAAISYHFSEEGKLYRQLDKMTTWTEEPDMMQRHYDKLNKAINDNKYDLDSLKVYKKAANHLTRAWSFVKDRRMTLANSEFKKYQEVRRNPNSVLHPQRSKLKQPKIRASK